MADFVISNVHANHAELVLNRPEKRNAFNREFLLQLNTLVDQLKSNEEINALVIRSNSETAFCSGVDLEVLESFKSPGEARQFALLLEETMLHLFQFPLPVIAVINGFAYGGGFGLAMAGDIRLMTNDAEVRFPAVRIGAILPISCTIRLNHFLGVSRSKELLLTGRAMPAAESVSTGLTHFYGDKEAVENRVQTYLKQFSKANREALILQKIAANQGIISEMAKYSSQSAENFAYLYASGYWKNIRETLKRKS